MDIGPTAGSIGPEGGTVTLGRATLSVPAGAVDTRVTITIERTDDAVPTGYVGYSPVYRFSPSGLSFRHPVVVKLPFVGNVARAQLYWSAASGVGYERVGGTVVGDTVVGSVTHFSEGFVGAAVGATDAGAVDAPFADAPSVDASIDAPVDAPSIDVMTPTDHPDAAAPDLPDTAAPDVGSCLACAPHPVAPQSMGGATSRRPLLRWTLPAGADGAHVDLCRDRALTSACLSIDAVGDHAAPSADLAAGTWYWRLRARIGGAIQASAGPTWQFRVGPRSSPIDTSSTPTPDVNGDGYADLLVGDITDDTAFVYHGSAAGIGPTPTGHVTCAPADGCGATVASAGDVNGDGFGDALVNGGGELRLYLGAPSGLAATAAQSLPLTGGGALVVAGVGDLDRDGYADALVGLAGVLSVYYGSPTGLATRTATITCGVAAGCGGQVAAAGDVNGDGYADVLVGAVEGGLEVHLGSATGLSATPQATLVGSSPFIGAAGLGDVNGDGYGDVAGYSDPVGSTPLPDHVSSDPYVARLYLGSATGISAMSAGNLPSGMGTGADVDGDGYTDLLVANQGNVADVAGSATGLIASGRSGASLSLHCTTQVVAADYNGDGRADAAFNCVRENASSAVPSGLAGVALGGPTGLGATTTLSEPEQGGFAGSLALAPTGLNFQNLHLLSTGSGSGSAAICTNLATGCLFLRHPAGQGFGASVAYASVVDGSGGDLVSSHANFLIGAPLTGHVYVMQARGIDDPGFPITDTITGVAAEGFGAAVAGVGDVNGDGVRDMIVGAPAGARAYVYLGSGSSYGPTPILLAGAAGSHFGRVVTGARDVNHDGYADVVVGADNQASVFLGGASGPRTTAAVTWVGAAGSGFATAIAGAGDVNHDGFADVIVGAPGAATAAVYYGAATLPTTPSVTLTGAAGSEFGAAVRGAGDMDVDGSMDLLVGAPGADSAYFFYGGSRLATANGMALTHAAGSRFGASIAWDGESDADTSLRYHVAIGAPGLGTIFLYERVCGSRGDLCHFPYIDPSNTRTAPTRSAYGVTVAHHAPRRRASPQRREGVPVRPVRNQLVALRN